MKVSLDSQEEAAVPQGLRRSRGERSAGIGGFSPCGQIDGAGQQVQLLLRTSSVQEVAAFELCIFPKGEGDHESDRGQRGEEVATLQVAGLMSPHFILL